MSLRLHDKFRMRNKMYIILETSTKIKLSKVQEHEMSWTLPYSYNPLDDFVQNQCFLRENIHKT